MSSPTESVSVVQALFIQHLPALRGFVSSLVSDFSLVDDIVQESFITVSAKAAGFEEGTNFRAWLFTIARYKTLQTVQKARPPDERFAPEVVEALCAHASSEDWLGERHLSCLRACLMRLAPKARHAVELRYQQANKPPEIARQMGWTVEAVHVALSRARVFLRDCVTNRLAEAEH